MPPTLPASATAEVETVESPANSCSPLDRRNFSCGLEGNDDDDNRFVLCGDQGPLAGLSPMAAASPLRSHPFSAFAPSPSPLGPSPSATPLPLPSAGGRLPGLCSVDALWATVEAAEELPLDTDGETEMAEEQRKHEEELERQQELLRLQLTAQAPPPPLTPPDISMLGGKVGGSPSCLVQEVLAVVGEPATPPASPDAASAETAKAANVSGDGCSAGSAAAENRPGEQADLAADRPQTPSQPQQLLVQMAPRLHNYLASDPLECMIAAGDILVVRGNGGGLAAIGQVGGFMGHVLVVLGPPLCIPRNSIAAGEIDEVWPSEEEAPGLTEVWKLRTVESTRRESGLYECETILFVDRATRKFMVIGEVAPDGEVVGCEEPEPAELWQSPEELRAELRIDLMTQVMMDMRASQANWSYATGIKAVFQTANVKRADGVSNAVTLQELVQCWNRPPICTSVVIAFWQRYLAKLSFPVAPPAGSTAGMFVEGERVSFFAGPQKGWIEGIVFGRNLDAQGRVVSYNLDIVKNVPLAYIRRPVDTRHSGTMALDLILKYMPLKADRALPGDLLKTMKECDWVRIVQVPRIFRSMVIQPPPVLFCTAPQTGASAAPSTRAPASSSASAAESSPTTSRAATSATAAAAALTAASTTAAAEAAAAAAAAGSSDGQESEENFAAALAAADGLVRAGHPGDLASSPPESPVQAERHQQTPAHAAGTPESKAPDRRVNLMADVSGGGSGSSSCREPPAPARRPASLTEDAAPATPSATLNNNNDNNNNSNNNNNNRNSNSNKNSDDNSHAPEEASAEEEEADAQAEASSAASATAAATASGTGKSERPLVHASSPQASRWLAAEATAGAIAAEAPTVGPAVRSAPRSGNGEEEEENEEARVRLHPQKEGKKLGLDAGAGPGTEGGKSAATGSDVFFLDAAGDTAALATATSAKQRSSEGSSSAASSSASNSFRGGSEGGGGGGGRGGGGRGPLPPPELEAL